MRELISMSFRNFTRKSIVKLPQREIKKSDMQEYREKGGDITNAGELEIRK